MRVVGSAAERAIRLPVPMPKSLTRADRLEIGDRYDQSKLNLGERLTSPELDLNW